MKKITLLFATMLAMSGMGFGQNQAKVLWEKEILPVGAYYTWEVAQSPQNNILLYGSDEATNPRRYLIKSFDKDGQNQFSVGKQLSDSTSYYFDKRFKNTVISTPVYVKALNSETYFETKMDSAVFLNENYQVIAKKATRGYAVDNDGSIIFIDHVNTVNKLDKNGNRLWQYTPSTKFRLFGGYGNGFSTSEILYRPYVGNVGTPIITKIAEGYLLQYTTDNISDSGYIFLDNSGKEQAVVKSLTYVVSATKDGGLIVQHDGFQKLNNKGVELWNFRDDSKFFAPNDNENTVNRNELVGILSDESLILQNFYATCENNLCNKYFKSLIKVNKEGKLVWQTDWIKDLNDRDLMSMKDEGFMTFTKENHFSGNLSSTWIGDPAWSAIHRFDKNGKLLWRFPTDNTIAVRKLEILPDNSFIVDYRAITRVNQNSVDSEYYVAKISAEGNVIWKYSVSNNLKPFIKISNGYAVAGYKDEGNMTNFYLNILDNNGNISASLKLNSSQESLYFNSIKEDADGSILLSSIVKQSQFSSRIFKISKEGKILNQISFSTANSIYDFTNLDIFNAGDGSYLLVSKTVDYSNRSQIFIKKFQICNVDILNVKAVASNTEACPTEKIKLSIPKQEGVTYQWQKDGKDLPNFKDAVYDISESGIYTVNVKDEICQNQATSNALKINIRSLPNAEIKAPRTTFCEGDKTTITATTNGVFFQWQKDQKDIPNATSGIFEASQTGDYRVGVRDDKCPQVGYSNTYTINVKPSPEASISTDIKTVIYEPFTVKMTANTGTNLSYQWLKNDTLITNATTNTYEAKKSGKYKVSVTKDGCLKTSEALTISIQIPLASEGEIGEETVQIYPNPSRGEFKIILPKTLQNADIQLFDMMGRERKLVHTGEQAQADGLVQGTYFLRVSKGEKSVVNKIVISGER